MNFRIADLPPALVPVARAKRPALMPFAAEGAADAPRLARGRVHEVTGSARAAFAVALAGCIPQDGPVFWIHPAWASDRLHPDGMRPLADPGRFLFVAVPRDADLLWCMEEVLRSGQAPLVVADLPTVPGLTAVRRLTLAAEGGAAAADGAALPTGLILTPGPGGAPGVETRWRLNAAHGAEGGVGWRLDRLRARMAPPAAFRVAPGRDGGLRVAADPVPVS